ncbi:oxidoreductase [Dietzia lutea]|uniref:Oxidoreductase n=2 Tax=Dietzia lutea TaxID=546160 RepID=A0A2S1RCK4_9ACTN|nr:oxidoreductase [Dietzia lutea]
MTEDMIDVLVIGSGAAGLAAAISAVEAGARSVVVAESEAVVGGSSRLSGGLVMGAGSRFQKAAGIDDSADLMFADYMALNYWDVDPGPVRRLAERSGATVDWVADLGVRFFDDLVFGGGESQPRVHVPDGGGQHVIDVLLSTCRRSDSIDIALGLRVDRLLVENRRVVGAAIADDEIRAGAVVVATGGFGANEALLAQHFPSAGKVPGAWYIGADGSRGDAIEWASDVTAQMAGDNRGLRLLDPGFVRELEAFLPGWLLMVDSTGRRFASEISPYGILDRLMEDRGDRAWMLFDSSKLEPAAGPTRYKHQLPGWKNRRSTNWGSDMLQEQVGAGRVMTADTVEELAQRLGLPAPELAGTVRRYNEFARNGEDIDYEKSAEFLDALDTPPFCAVEVRPRTVCWTGYGVRIDRDARVLDQTGGVVPGLYAAGEVTGGVLGRTYVGSGNAYANCLVFGRVAGASAAALSLTDEVGAARPQS